MLPVTAANSDALAFRQSPPGCCTLCPLSSWDEFSTVRVARDSGSSPTSVRQPTAPVQRFRVRRLGPPTPRNCCNITEEMGWRFQRRIRIAPVVTVNLSKSGVGSSLGRNGSRIGVNAKHKKYFSIRAAGNRSVLPHDPRTTRKSRDCEEGMLCNDRGDLSGTAVCSRNQTDLITQPNRRKHRRQPPAWLPSCLRREPFMALTPRPSA
jgi:hypothetical protein